ncbi:hypothetical protein CA265_23020 [Sphingobacteriaceae bacterium GW460-11-11-14-LB5]|nr:hypothetical protein CA265_23020 [Sphingobacteriaceae bacterium GW460-11-11-14-LB5]
MIFVACCISCKQKKQTKHFKIKVINSPSKARIDSTNKKQDSLFHTALNHVFTLIKANSKNTFNKSFSTTQDNHLDHNVKVEIKLGYLFSQRYKNLLIKSASNLETRIYIYSSDGTDFNQLMTKKYSNYSFPIFSIKDINADGLKDFLVNWYPESGCCRRNIYDLYLSKANKTFSKEITLVNPTFYSKEKVIRGVTYDHPGLASLYKFKWNKLNLDTVEYIYPNLKDTLQLSFIKSSQERYSSSKSRKLVQLKSLTKEYHAVSEIDYFKSYDLEDIKAISKNYNN